MEPMTARRRRWLLARGLLRALVTTTVLIAGYYVLPLDRLSGDYVAVSIVIGVALLTAAMVWQVRAIENSEYPGIRAVQTLASSITLFLLLFASAYVILSAGDTRAFTEPLSRSDALYFTVTVFATVGFGDISAQAETARLVVTVQMLLDLVVLGIGIRVIAGAVKRARSGPASASVSDPASGPA